MKRIFQTIILFIAGCLSVSAAAGRLVSGRPSNGLTYYILHNSTPGGSADFFLVQRTGSVFEDENQRGLAHFLEHLCFNGTEHFPDNSLISWLESKGVKFGSNLNAYTGTDETVYNISKVPVESAEILDSCLLALYDWSTAVTFDNKTIDAERGVIVNEWRHRNSAGSRMLEKALPHVYPGSKYGVSMPIGRMEVVENFETQTIIDFYKRWYHPANQAIIVVGDVNTDDVKTAIENRFSSIPAGKDVITSLPAVPDNENRIIEVQTDPEQGVNMLQVYFKHPKYSDALAADLATTLLASRFDPIEMTDTCPHTYLGIGDVKFLMSSGVDALVMRGVVKPGMLPRAASLWYTELVRAIRHGFTKTKVDYAKAQMRKSLSDKLNKARNANNTTLARALTRSFLDREDYVPETESLKADLERIDNLSGAHAMAYLNAIVDLGGRNNIVLAYMPADVPAVDNNELAAAIQHATNSKPEPFVAVGFDRPLLATEPTPGHIVSKEPYHFPGTSLYTLSNGIRVITWLNDSVAGQIFVRGIGTGGLSQEYADSLAPTFKYINDLVAISGFGDFSNLDLKRAVATRDVATSINIKNTEEIIEAATTPSGLEDAMRLIYLKATSLNPDSAAFNNWLATERNKLRNVHTNPIQAMGDSIHRNVYNHHPLGLKETPEMLDRVDYGRAITATRNRFADMADFTFYITGDFDTDTLEQLLERYIAALPAAGRIERPMDIDYIFTPGKHVIRFEREMQSPVSVVYNFYHGPADYNLANILAVNILNNSLKMRLLADLRETRGWTYSIQGHGALTADMNAGYPPMLMMPVYIKTEPGHEDETYAIVNSTLNELLTVGPTAEEVDKARLNLAKNYRNNLNDNAYRLSVLRIYDHFGQDMHTDYLDILDSLTPAEIAARTSPLTTNHSLLIMSAAAAD